MIQVSNYGNANQEQMIKLKAALDLCNQANASGALKYKVMTAEFTETTDTNDVIYANTQKDVSISVSFYTPGWWARLKQTFSGLAVVAAECGNGDVQFNSVVFAQNSVSDVAATLSHERMHSPQAGSYTHSYLPCADRPMSVPYACGTFVQQVIESRSF